MGVVVNLQRYRLTRRPFSKRAQTLADALAYERDADEKEPIYVIVSTHGIRDDQIHRLRCMAPWGTRIEVLTPAQLEVRRREAEQRTWVTAPQQSSLFEEKEKQ